MKNEWFIRQHQKTFGPFSEQQLQQLALDGRFTADAQLSVDGQSWFPATKVAGLTFPAMSHGSKPLTPSPRSSPIPTVAPPLTIDATLSTSKKQSLALRSRDCWVLALGVAVGMAVFGTGTLLTRSGHPLPDRTNSKPTHEPGQVPATSQLAAQEQQLIVALESPTRLVYVEMPLTEVVKYLRELHSVPIDIDVPALEKVSVGSDTPITFDLQGITLRSALNAICETLGLVCVVRDVRLRITTQEAMLPADQHLGTNSPEIVMRSIETIWKKLSAPAQLDRSSPTLRDALEALASQHELSLKIDSETDWQDFQKPNPVTNVDGRSAAEALELMLAPQGYWYVVRHEILWVIPASSVRMDDWMPQSAEPKQRAAHHQRYAEALLQKR